LAVAACLALTGEGALAGEAAVRDATLTPSGDGTWRIEVTVEHADAGWDHYADAWEVLAPDGTVLATRTLLHPHETEQPFTRSLSGLAIPDDVVEVIIRAHDSVHGYGGPELTVGVPREELRRRQPRSRRSASTSSAAAHRSRRRSRLRLGLPIGEQKSKSAVSSTGNAI
jgi:hypothetical protein